MSVNLGNYRHKPEQIYKELIGFTSAVGEFADGIAICCLESKLIYANNAFARMHGYCPEEMIGLEVRKLYREKEMDEYKRSMEQIRTQGSWRGEIGHIKKDGTPFPAYMSITLLKDKEQKPIGILAVSIDITERKKAEDALKLAHTELNQIFNIAADGIRVIDKDFNVLRINETFSNLSGISKDEALNKKCYENFRGSLCHSSGCSLKRISSGEKRIECEVEKERNDGIKISCILTATSFREPNGELIGIVEHFKDITKRKQAEDEIKQQQKMLKEFSQAILSIKEEEKKKFSTNLHDEAGSMVVCLSSSLSIAEKAVKDKNVYGALESINETKCMLKKSVDSLRKIARDLRPPDLDTVGIVDTLRLYFLPIAKQAKINIDFSTDIAEEELNDGVAIVLYRVAQEALNNIIKHAEARNVEVRLYSQDSKLKFNICDDGKGFDVKRSVQEPEAPKMGILGMRERVESLGGVFTIESAPKKGTRISVALPKIEVDKS